MPYNLNPLIQPQRNSQTLGVPTNFVFDRESGKTLVIEYPSFDLVMSDSLLSFTTDLNRLPRTKLFTLLKCLLILQSLPEIALEEAVGEIAEIANFHANRFPRSRLPAVPGSSIRGALRSAQIRPPIVLGP
jgi:hypothetical protein